MEKIINTKKYILFTLILVIVSLFFYVEIGSNVADAYITSGSILMNYDYDGGEDPDCVGMPTSGKFIVWGDHKGSSSSPAAGQFNFCLNSAVKYASGLSDISGLNISYEKVARLPSGGNFTGESNKTYYTYRVFFEPKVLTLVASCTANPSSVEPGDTVTWTVTATGGLNQYTYNWSGTDGLTGSSRNIYKAYTTPGTKSGTVTVTSDDQSITKNCSTTVNEITNTNLVVSCSANPMSANVNDNITWQATASGGNNQYVYSWSGNDGLSGNGKNLFWNYSNTGTKRATVSVTSDGQTITASCTSVINENINDDLSVSCSASPTSVDVDEDVTWRANATGGNGSYRYDWSGTDGLDGTNRTVSWSYDNNGTKRAYISVTSNGQIANASCTTRVNEEVVENDPLSVSCYSTPSNPQTGTRVKWYCNVDGGDGDYTYDWTGTDGLDSSSKTPYKSYTTAGTKRAYVTVRDGSGERVSKTVSTNVRSVLAYTEEYQTPVYPLVYSDQSAVQPAAVYLSQVPYTGVADNYKLVIYLSILAAISAYIAYVVMSYKKNNA